jgi:UDP-N-acetylglucosamine 2-epimerase (non-hydrolysing)
LVQTKHDGLRRIQIVMGSRPDIIKLWPVYYFLKQNPKVSIHLTLSGQHVDMAEDALDTFHLYPNTRISLQEYERVDLSYMTGSLIRKLSDNFQNNDPEFVVVHGDVVTAFAAATAAFLNKIPVGHVEAGLRTSRFENPHPEEGIRRMISRVTTLHFAPTQYARDNLIREHIDPSSIFVTGNTVVDSLVSVIGSSHGNKFYVLEGKDLDKPIYTKKILLTCHRRESWGKPLKDLCETIRQMSEKHKDYLFIWPVHGNPKVSQIVYANLGGINNIILSKPLSYRDFVVLLNQIDILVTDSGGVIEEASYLNIPTFVLRNEIERPEALTLSNVHLLGYDFSLLYRSIRSLNNVKRDKTNSIFGDGYSGERIGKAIVQYLEKGIKNEQVEENKVNSLVNYTPIEG